MALGGLEDFRIEEVGRASLPAGFGMRRAKEVYAVAR
jgi:hypothetical protein